MEAAIAIVLAVLTATGAARTSGDDPMSPDCVDAVVSARMVKQTPTVAGSCGDQCIVMEWPWIVELQVSRVIDGAAPRGRLKVLTVQHTYYVVRSQEQLWRLRRNTQGGFNALRFGDDLHPALCAKDVSPAKPFVQPGKGQTLDDLEKEGERYYGPHL